MISRELLLGCPGIKAVSGNGDNFISAVSTDSRAFQSKQIFIALEGERFDGFNYVDDLVQKGAQAIVYRYEKQREEELQAYGDLSLFVGVEDTLLFLQNLANLRAKEWRDRTGGKIVAMTGSNGKTTTKEMLYELMDAGAPGKIHCTQGNFNNHIGLPLTLLAVEDDHQYMIAEMGTNHPGEINVLCDIAEPEVGFITNIGSSHLEFFHTEENVFMEKSDLYRSVTSRNGRFFINEDDQFLRKLEGEDRYGSKGTRFKIDIGPEGFEISGQIDAKVQNKQIVGEYNRHNLAVSYVVATSLLGEDPRILEAAETFKPRGNRSLLIERGDKLVFLDAYNANPSSMKAALDSFSSLCVDRKISLDNVLIILGDMNELGEDADLAHQKIGKQAADLGFRNALFVGKFGEDYGDGFGKGCRLFNQSSEIAIDSEMKKFSAFFIKGSRSLKLETLVDMS